MKMAKRRISDLRCVIYSAVLLALALVLPLITGNIPIVGKTLSPMHFPVLLAGFAAGPFWGAAVGFLAPLLRNLIFGMPAPIYPKALRMAFELCGYGFFSGFFYSYLPKKTYGIYLSLISAMCFGRLCYGLSWFIFSLFDPANEFYLDAVIAATVSSTAFGMLFQILLIPPIVLALQKAQLIPSRR